MGRRPGQRHAPSLLSPFPLSRAWVFNNTRCLSKPPILPVWLLLVYGLDELGKKSSRGRIFFWHCPLPEAEPETIGLDMCCVAKVIMGDLENPESLYMLLLVGHFSNAKGFTKWLQGGGRGHIMTLTMI